MSENKHMPESTNTLMHVFKHKLDLMPENNYPIEELDKLEAWAEAIARDFAKTEVERFMDCLTTMTSNEQWIFSPDLGSSEDGFAWAKYEYEWDHSDDSGEADGYVLQGEGKSKGSLLKHFDFNNPEDLEGSTFESLAEKLATAKPETT